MTASKPLTGGVTFYDYGNVMAGPYAPSNGQAQLVVGGGFYGIGVHQITAKYGGDMNNLSSTSSVLNQVITGTTAVTIQGNTGGDVHYVQATIGIQ